MKLKLNGNALKVIAMVTMFLDHFGMILFPDVKAFRVVGRVSFPIYAYLISEGCKYTSDRKRYFLRISVLGTVCSLVYILVERYIYLCVLITFSMSILLIYLLDYVKSDLKRRHILLIMGLLLCWAVCHSVEVDYGFMGVLVPVMTYLSDKRRVKTVLFAISLILLTLSVGNDVQVYCLVAVVLVSLYDGTHGKVNLKWFFYSFYPVHLALLYGIAIVMPQNFAS